MKSRDRSSSPSFDRRSAGPCDRGHSAWLRRTRRRITVPAEDRVRGRGEDGFVGAADTRGSISSAADAASAGRVTNVVSSAVGRREAPALTGVQEEPQRIGLPDRRRRRSRNRRVRAPFLRGVDEDRLIGGPPNAICAPGLEIHRPCRRYTHEQRGRRHPRPTRATGDLAHARGGRRGAGRRQTCANSHRRVLEVERDRERLERERQPPRDLDASRSAGDIPRTAGGRHLLTGHRLVVGLARGETAPQMTVWSFIDRLGSASRRRIASGRRTSPCRAEPTATQPRLRGTRSTSARPGAGPAAAHRAAHRAAPGAIDIGRPRRRILFSRAPTPHRHDAAAPPHGGRRPRRACAPCP